MINKDSLTFMIKNGFCVTQLKFEIKFENSTYKKWLQKIKTFFTFFWSWFIKIILPSTYLYAIMYILLYLILCHDSKFGLQLYFERLNYHMIWLLECVDKSCFVSTWTHWARASRVKAICERSTINLSAWNFFLRSTTSRDRKTPRELANGSLQSLKGRSQWLACPLPRQIVVDLAHTVRGRRRHGVALGLGLARLLKRASRKGAHGLLGFLVSSPGFTAVCGLRGS